MGLFTIHQQELGQKKPSSSLLHRANWRWLATCPLLSVSPTAAPWQSQHTGLALTPTRSLGSILAAALTPARRQRRICLVSGAQETIMFMLL